MTKLQRLKTIAVTGGTFDPIHRGHVETVLSVCEQVELDEVRYIPASVPPHRAQPKVSAENRMTMVELATSRHSNLSADDRELRRAGPSYTIDTLAELKVESPNASLILLLGLDAFLGLPTWHRWTEVLNVAHIIVMNRPGWTQPDPLPKWWQDALVSQVTPSTTTPHLSSSASMVSDPLLAVSHNPAGHIVSVNVAPVDVSSTEVRRRLANGDMPTDMLDPAVAEFIAAHQLYEWRL